MEVRFSIIIPIYKVEKYLCECVDSVLSQTYRNIEVILVDDGSPDNCPQICDDYSKRDERVRVIHKVNGGLSSARNAGLKIAAGEYVIFLDSDDYYVENTFLESVDAVIEQYQCDAVFFRRRKYIDAQGIFSSIPAPYDDSWREQTCSEILLSLSREDKLDASAAMKVTRRDFLIENALFFKEGIVSEDVEWFFRYAPKLRRIALLNGAPYCCRIREGSITHSITAKNVNDLFYSIATYAEELRDGNSPNKLALLNYLAYEYDIVLGLCGNSMRGAERKALLKKCKQYKWLANYSVSSKTKMSALLIKTMGVKISSVILGIYAKNK